LCAKGDRKDEDESDCYKHVFAQEVSPIQIGENSHKHENLGGILRLKHCAQGSLVANIE